MRFLRGLTGVVLRFGGAFVAAWGVVQLFDGHPVRGSAAIVLAFGLVIAGTALRSHPTRRTDLADALYMGGDDMIGYRSHVLRRRHRR